MEEHVRDEHSTFTWLLEVMFERTGFSIEAVDYSDDGYDAVTYCGQATAERADDTQWHRP